jgi:hypothetical protein
MPEGLTQTKTPTFSETRPEIDRNGGRLQIGTVAGFKSENPAGINRNPHLTSGPFIETVPLGFAEPAQSHPVGAQHHRVR